MLKKWCSFNNCSAAILVLLSCYLFYFGFTRKDIGSQIFSLGYIILAIALYVSYLGVKSTKKNEHKNDRKIKQVIVMRTRYPDGKGGLTGLRRGKEIAQGSHASSLFLVTQLKSNEGELRLSEVERMWLKGSFAKTVLKVSTEEELQSVAEKAKLAGLKCHIVEDAGRTEFHGVKTKTCLAIGPDYADKIDQVTGNLPLY